MPDWAAWVRKPSPHLPEPSMGLGAMLGGTGAFPHPSPPQSLQRALHGGDAARAGLWLLLKAPALFPPRACKALSGRKDRLRGRFAALIWEAGGDGVRQADPGFGNTPAWQPRHPGPLCPREPWRGGLLWVWGGLLFHPGVPLIWGSPGWSGDTPAPGCMPGHLL